MSNYSGPLHIKYDPVASAALGTPHVRLLTSFKLFLPQTVVGNEWTAYDPDTWIFCNAGMLTDLGTIPDLFRGMFPSGGKYSQAYVVHDQACEYLSITVGGRPKRITRQEADLILLYALQELGMDKQEAYTIYNAVAAYQMARQITKPSTTIMKRRLEAAYNFEGLL